MCKYAAPYVTYYKILSRQHMILNGHRLVYRPNDRSAGAKQYTPFFKGAGA